MSRRSRRGIWALLGLGLVLLLLHPLVSPQRTLIYRDNLPYTLPLNHVIRAALLEGRLPEWDSTQYTGVPFLANPSSQALYLPRWAAVLATESPAEASDLFALLHFALALLGGVALGRELGLERGPRRLLAVTYATGGPLLSLLGNLVYLVGAAWLPLSLAWILRARRKATPGGWPYASAVALAGLGLAPPFYGGDPQTAGWLALVAALVLLAPGDQAAPLRRRLLGLVGIGGASFLLCLALLVPAALLTGETTRSAGLDYSMIGRWSFHPARLSELFFAHPFGLPFPERSSYVGGALEPVAQDLWSHTFFLGAGLLLFVCRSLGPLPEGLRRARAGLVGLTLAALLLAFGRHTPIHPWLATHTPYGIFRYPEKHLTLVALALAGLAGVGLQAFLAARPWRSPKGLLPFLALPLAGLALVSPLSAWIQSLAEGADARPPELGPQALSAVLVQLWLLGLLALPRFGPRRRATLVVVAVALCGAVTMSRLTMVGHTSLVEEVPPPVEALRHELGVGPLPQRFERDPPRANFGHYPAGYLSSAEVGALVGQASLLGASGAAFDLPGLLGMTGFTPRRLAKLKAVTPPPEFRARAATAHLVHSLDERGSRRTLNAGYGVGISPLEARPRLELLSGVHWVADEEAAWAALAEVSTRVVVAVGAGASSSESRSLGVATPKASMGSRNTGRVEVQVSTPAAALLVVRDAWFPGWEARVDGAPAPIHVVDGAFMGVRVPPGEHEVALRYRTPGFRASAWLSALAWLLVLSLILYGLAKPAGAAPIKSVD